MTEQVIKYIMTISIIILGVITMVIDIMMIAKFIQSVQQGTYLIPSEYPVYLFISGFITTTYVLYIVIKVKYLDDKK